MKKLFSTMLFLCSVMIVLSQENFSKREEFRSLAKVAFNERETELKAMYSLADSLDSKAFKVNLSKLDSLSADSINGSFYKPLVELEKHFYYVGIQMNDMSLTALRKFQSAIGEMPMDDEFAVRAHTYAMQEFEEAGDIASANVSMKKLWAVAEMKVLSSEKIGIALTDSMNSKVTALEREMSNQKKSLGDTNLLYLEGLAAAGLVILILFIAFFMMRWKLRKRIHSLLKKQPDTSEADLLAQKVIDLQNETLQFKKTAQSTVNKLNSMDTANRNATEELALLSSDVEKSLDELKQQCITNKASISPPVYMAIQNLSTRLGNAAADRIKTIENMLS